MITSHVHSIDLSSEPYLTAEEELSFVGGSTFEAHANPSASEKVSCIDWSALDKPVADRTWWMPDWLSPAPTLIAGAGGKGKSMLMQAIATSLATGLEYITPVASPLTCLMWSCEDDALEILRRQARINTHLHVGPGCLTRLHVAARAGCDNVLYELQYGRAKPTALLSRLREQVNDLRAEVLVLDNINQCFGGASADAHQVTSFVNCINGLVTDRPFAPIFVGHVARTPGSEFAGSAAWENAVRMRWHLGSTKPTDDRDEGDQYEADTLYFSRRKSNYSSIGYVALTRVDGMLVPESSAARIAARRKRDSEVDQILLSGLREMQTRKMAVSEKPTSPDFVPKALLKLGLAGNASRPELAASLTRGLAAGRLQIARIGRYPNGQMRFGPVEA